MSSSSESDIENMLNLLSDWEDSDTNDENRRSKVYKTRPDYLTILDDFEFQISEEQRYDLCVISRWRAFDSSCRAASPRQALKECACDYSVSAELPEYFDEQIVNLLIMALTAAEKQKRYREQLKKIPDKYEEAKRKHRELYHKSKRFVKDLTPKEKRNANTIWKLRQQAYRKKLKSLQNVLNVTPPSSPASSVHNIFEGQHTPPLSPVPDSPSVRGRKKVRKDRSKVYRENEGLKKEIEQLKRTVEKYKKRAQRVNLKKNVEDNILHDKYKILASSIKNTYHETKNRKGKTILKNILNTEQIEESRRKTQLFKDVLGINRKYNSKKQKSTKSDSLKGEIQNFFLRDDITRATAGKKETVTKHGEKVQKRHLLETQRNLYNIFKAENPDFPCSYYYFTKNDHFTSSNHPLMQEKCVYVKNTLISHIKLKLLNKKM
ncbi:unnamed protein product [Diatraea saccharalis]|uniref:Uncharacterized protein n=1 Tax=Diatraea saccharalis TaxID=40085 RepID=A0A9N9RB62_9NEOP|nr:unnamed protein product [Diatraea saccharalis]